MLTAIQGTYENGQVTLKETPKTDHKMNVIVTFLEEEMLNVQILKPRIPGSLKGKIRISDDFNEPLEDLKEYM
jgi:hypothetical protein